MKANHISADFWKLKTLDQLLQLQQVKPAANIAETAGDFWPEEEPVDDFVEYIYRQRQEGRLIDCCDRSVL